METYFIKFLPAEGIPQDGDWFKFKGIIKKTSIPAFFENPYVQYMDGLQRVSPFLYSKDIKVGDWVAWDNGQEIEVQEDIISALIKDNCFKIIGQISLEAYWIHEDDEILIENCRKIKMAQFRKDLLKLKYDLYKLKGPCGHFH